MRRRKDDLNRGFIEIEGESCGYLNVDGRKMWAGNLQNLKAKARRVLMWLLIVASGGVSWRRNCLLFDACRAVVYHQYSVMKCKVCEMKWPYPDFSCCSSLDWEVGRNGPVHLITGWNCFDSPKCGLYRDWREMQLQQEVLERRHFRHPEDFLAWPQHGMSVLMIYCDQGKGMLRVKSIVRLPTH